MTRVAGWLAGAWVGVLLAIAGIAAPSAFAVLPREAAGQVVARLFAQEAALSLALALLLFLIERRLQRDAGGPALTANVLLLLGTLFCTIAGYYALQPLLADARAGQAAWSFGALHAVSMAFYALRTILVGVLAWRLAAR